MVSITAPAIAEEQDLYSMVYISRITSAGMMAAGTLNDIAATAIANNQQNNITGVLCYGNGYFFQYLEGSEDALTRLKNELILDTRHKDMQILQFNRLAERAFTGWSLQSLVLENWLLDKSKMKKLLPFRPDKWQGNDWEVFLNILKEYLDQHEQEQTPPVQYNTLGFTVTRLFSDHQAFFVVQAILGMLVLITVASLMMSSF